MRIESIEIKNFRQYRNEVFKFPKKAGNKDIHIIIGENGEGKTNILNALTWCLYGEELHLGDKNTAIRMINSQYVNELKQEGKKSGEVSVTVRMSLEEESSTMDFMRTAVFSITAADAINTKSYITAVQTGGAKGANVFDKEEDVKIWISRYVPREINEYIFFDGELMDQYFKDSQRKNIETGIKNLTQATILDKTIKHIESYERLEIAPLLRNNGDDQVAAAQRALESAWERFNTQQEKVKSINDNIKKLEEQRGELTSLIKGHDNLKSKMYELERVDNQITSLTRQEKAQQEELIRFVQEYYVYFTLYPALKKLYSFINKQEKAGNLPPKVDRNLIKQIVDTKQCSICGNALDTDHLMNVMAILKKLEVSSATSNELSKASIALRGIFDLLKQYNTKKRRIMGEIKRIKDELKTAEDVRVELNLFLRTIPNTDEITTAIQQREVCVSQLDKNKRDIGREEHILSQYEKAVEIAQDALDKAMKSNDRMGIFRKQLDFCKKSVRVLSTIKDEILQECRLEMQKETFDFFNRLIWKNNAFSKVNILENYSFELLDQYGDQTLGSCSAAERALLALSFTIALQQTSGHDSLLYIDTPLGRVGEKNRVNFMDVLLEVAKSKQVILSFTPTEYDDNVRAQLNNQYSSYCELNYQDGITTKRL